MPDFCALKRQQISCDLLTAGAVLRTGALQLDEVAGVAAARALELRENNEKGSRARKKAALTDLLRTLAAVGVSKLRSAVPASDRTVQAWFRQVRWPSLLCRIGAVS